ncbi:glycosyltransferase family 4 protein [Leisingera caerulea]|uniref:glycosyltransferase family 4 protein n=1 Tax=Leisingera caerulea TaxID=506591 RepID=UPI00047F60B9|nr:glycosyltransferase family 4 protein [Leisingera caerulea]
MTDRTKRVVLVMDYGDVRGGLEKVCIESALALKAQGKDVVFFCGVPPLDPRLEAAGIETHCLGVSDIASNASRLAAIRTGLWNRTAGQKLDQVIRDTDDLSATVVHVHCWTKSLSSAIGPVVTAPDVRHVFTMHEYFFACPNGGFFDYPRNGICGKRAMSLSCMVTNCDVRNPAHKAFRVVRQGMQKTFGRLPRGVRNIIYISELQHEVMRSYFPAATRFFNVANPVIDEKPEQVDVAANEAFVFVGRLAAAKGGVEFAHAAKAAGVRAVFIGDGPQKDEIRAACPEAEILGWIESSQVAGLLREARALVFPSLWYECQPLVPLEALAAGIPVISGDWTAGRESVVNGRNGIIIKDLDPQGSFGAALAALKDPEAARRYGNAAYQMFWADPLTMGRHLDRLNTVYEAI